MPEALACFVVISFSLALIAYARVQGSHASRRTPGAERLRAEQPIAGLEARRSRARRERWAVARVAALETQLQAERPARDRAAGKPADSSQAQDDPPAEIQ